MEQDTAPRTHGLLIEWAARYDLLVWLLTHGRERELRLRFINLAGLAPGDERDSWVAREATALPQRCNRVF